MGERMDGWPLTWKREGRAGWREVALEIEEKKRGDVNQTEGMSLTSSASLEREMHRIFFCQSCWWAVEPGGVMNSKE